MNEVKFAGTVIEVENQVVAKVTSFNRSLSISEEDVTGSEDIKGASDVLQQQFVALAVGETANLAGIAIEGLSGLDEGQSELRDAADSGETVVLKHTKNNGYGHQLTGFFTSYEETASTAGVYKFSGTFRVNARVDITPGS